MELFVNGRKFQVAISEKWKKFANWTKQYLIPSNGDRKVSFNCAILRIRQFYLQRNDFGRAPYRASSYIACEMIWKCSIQKFSHWTYLLFSPEYVSETFIIWTTILQYCIYYFDDLETELTSLKDSYNFSKGTFYEYAYIHKLYRILSFAKIDSSWFYYIDDIWYAPQWWKIWTLQLLEKLEMGSYYGYLNICNIISMEHTDAETYANIFLYNHSFLPPKIRSPPLVALTLRQLRGWRYESLNECYLECVSDCGSR